MPPLRDFLTRFRPAGSPGAAEHAGALAERPSELESEVAPVLALLADTEAERERLITQARHDAEQIVADAQAAAAMMAADAAQRAAMLREQAARQAMTAAREQAARAMWDARQHAAQTQELAGQRMPALVSRVVGRIRQLEAEDP
jgi:vacuolar-type H+-ATPase subunit H